MRERQDEWEDEGGAGTRFGLHDFVSLTRRHMKFLVATVVTMVAAAVLVSLALPNQYEGTATVKLEPSAKKIVGIDAVIQDLKGDAQTLESEVEIVRSAAVLGRVVEVLGLRTDSEFNQPGLWTKVRQRLGLGSGAPTVAADSRSQSPALKGRLDYLENNAQPGTTAPWQDGIIDTLAARLKVYRVRDTLLVNIKFRSQDPVKAARIANTVAEVYIRLQREAKQRANSEASGLLKTRVKQLRQTLSDVEQRLETFKARNDIFDSEGHLLLDRQLSREMEALVRVRAETAKTKAEYEQSRRAMLEGSFHGAVSDVLENPLTRVLNQGLTEALRRQAEMQTKYGPRHPAMERITADVAKAQNALTSHINKIIRGLRTKYRAAKEREAELEANLVKLKAAVVRHKSTEATYRELDREATATRNLYESMLKRMKQVSETVNLQYADARVVQRASIPKKPASPQRRKIVLLAFVGSLAIGFALVFLLEFAQPGFVRSDDIERSLDLPQLAAFPALPAIRDRFGTDELRSVRLMLAAPSSAFAESIRALRHELDARRPHDGCRIILVTSALPNEGCSLTASNLAHYMALSGYQTLLVDADMRRGQLSHALGLAGRPGLLDVLAQDCAPLDAVLVDQKTGLNVLPARMADASASSAPELLSSRALPSTLVELKAHFDTIILDAPPVLPVTDARLLAAHADQIAFVMTWRRTPKELVRRSIKLLGQNQDKIAGVVVNRVEQAALDEMNGGTRSVAAMPAQGHIPAA